MLKNDRNGSHISRGTSCWNIFNVIKNNDKGCKSCNTWCQNICNIVYLPHKKCEKDRDHYDTTQTTTIWSKVLGPGVKPRFWLEGDWPHNMELSNVYFIFKFQYVVEFDYLLRDWDSLRWHPHKIFIISLTSKDLATRAKLGGAFLQCRGGGVLHSPLLEIYWLCL